MGTLYIDRKNSELRHQGQRLLLYVNGRREQTIPFNLLDRVVMRGQVQTSTATLGALTAAGIAVTMLTGRFGNQLATVYGTPHNDGRRRQAQYRATTDPAAQLDIARYLLRRKLLGQQRLLQRARIRRPEHRAPLGKAVNVVQGLRHRLNRPDLTIGALRGVEGAAASAYFGAYRLLFAPSLGFDGRKRRPPPDPVNACLSLGYTLAHAEAVRVLFSAGLDPYLGFLHEPDFGRESLAADLIEPLRPRIDRWVWRLFVQRLLREDHFHRDDGGACLLGKTGRGIFYTEYETLGRWQHRWMRRQTYQLVNHLLQRGPTQQQPTGAKP